MSSGKRRPFCLCLNVLIYECVSAKCVIIGVLWLGSCNGSVSIEWCLWQKFCIVLSIIWHMDHINGALFIHCTGNKAALCTMALNCDIVSAELYYPGLLCSQPVLCQYYQHTGPNEVGVGMRRVTRKYKQEHGHSYSWQPLGPLLAGLDHIFMQGMWEPCWGGLVLGNIECIDIVLSCLNTEKAKVVEIYPGRTWICLFYISTTMTADVLVTQGARASTAMVMTKSFRRTRIFRFHHQKD